MSAVNAAALLAAAGGDYQISRSVRLRSSASAYFSRLPSTTTNQKTWTFSGWVKRGALGADQVILGTADTGSFGYFVFLIRFTSSDTIRVLQTPSGSGTPNIQFDTTAVFRDPSAWYHITLAMDTTQATNSNGVKLWVNGVLQAGTFTSYTQNQNTSINYNASTMYLGRYSIVSPTAYLDGYITEVNFIDGQALTPSSFGETDAVTGVWKPKKYAGTYGTNGFFLNFSDNSAATAAAIGKDYSGNGNNWTPNNISVTAGVTYDSMLDVPTMWADGGNGRGNYCTMNPLKSGTNLRPDHANLFALMQSNGSGLNQSVTATIYVSSGKWYWEGTSFNTVSGYGQQIGIASDVFNALNAFTGSSGQTYGYEKSGLKYNGSTSTAYGAAYTSNDVIGVALDLDAGTITFYKNGVTQGTAFTGISGNFTPFCGLTYNGGGPGFYMNFGQRPFAYTPPTGFKALNTQNLPDATIKKGNQYFDATTYTGNGSALTVTNSGSMQPDLLWTKQRSSTAWHYLQDAVRGVNKALFSNATDAEYSISPTTTTLNSNGFSFNGGESGLNANGQTYVAWQWKAGGTTVSNTSGSITSQVSANVAAGFSIVTWTGTGAANATVGHGLGVAPKLYIMKKRNGTGALPVAYTIVDGSLDFMYLNTTSAAGNASQPAPTSSVINVQSASGDNELNAQLVAYLFAEVAGFSAFGKYTGNGSADGPFVYLGFRPRYILLKRTDSAPTNWVVIDTATSNVNVSSVGLIPNLSNAEFSSNILDILSSGFKLRSTGAGENASGGTYIFVAFAENPFKNSLAR